MNNNEREKVIFSLFIIGVLLCVLSVMFCLSGCTEAERKSTEISRQADEFKTPRKLTIINTRTDKVILEFTGTFSVQSSAGAIDILCAIDDNRYEKHFFTLNDWTIYVVEDVSNDGVALYYTDIQYYPNNY